MRATKENILEYLKEIKGELYSDGIISLALFGSFARSEQSVYSDIDIAIKKESSYLKKRTAYTYLEEISKIKQMIQKKFHRNSDVFDLDSDSPMKENIKKELLYV
ncbi:nucleotidyltransferase domain-containing protein [Sulfurimonas sp. SAG-AH-194-C21]|nr:nucleotidyltransferase domain-containing protein [Sulfurimonas sp. SAG-AH-194-C21]MDF1883842.1 nucleotidyltransferase domain-containing protein [Sulfurimonas sp. SAG-AH-194-C21]